MNQDNSRSHALSKEFLCKLNPEKGGIYGPLVSRVRRDKDLDLEFRGNYINIYYQGHSILKLYQSGGIDISEVFTRNLAGFPKSLKTSEEVDKYLELLPNIKDNVTYRDENRRSSKSRELEFEQLLIRANNLESRNNSEYIILDRQYVVTNKGKKDRWDLVALRWPRDKRGFVGGNDQKGHLSIIEVKYGLNPDIPKLKSQIKRYGDYLEQYLEAICTDMQQILRDKLDLGLIIKTEGQSKRLKLLPLDTKIETTEIIVYLIDYNPYSKLIEKAEKPEFSGKVRIARGGLALWQANLTDFGAGG